VNVIGDGDRDRPSPEIRNTETVIAYQWGDASQGWHLLTSAALDVLLERMPPSTSEIRHVHDRTSQFYFVLKGRATIDIGGTLVDLSANDGVEVPPGTEHQIRNEASAALEFLVMSSGPPRADRRDIP